MIPREGAAAWPRPTINSPQKDGSSAMFQAMVRAWDDGAVVTAEDVLHGPAEVDAESAIRLIRPGDVPATRGGPARRNGRGRRRFPRWGAELRPCLNAIA